VSGRGRKQPNRGGKGRQSRPAPKKGAGPSRTPQASAPRQQEPARPVGTRTRDTQPVAEVRSRRPAVESPGAERAARRQRALRKKRNQRLGVVIGAVALGGAAIGSVIAGMAGGAEPTDRTAIVTSTSAAPSGAEPAAETGAAGTSAAPAPAGLTITCPAGGGASPVFGHDIIVPPPYEITIDYGDGDVYTNDSDNLGAIFSHTYADPGTYTVNAVLTLPAGATTSATCDYTW
jgi:hypothetical protein